MRRNLFIILAAITVVGLGLARTALFTSTATSPAQAQLANTPAAPGEFGSLVSRLPAEAAPAPTAPPSDPVKPHTRDQTADAQRMLARAQALRQSGRKFQVNTSHAAALPPGEQSLSETCVPMLANSQMDIIETGGGTGILDTWLILYDTIYFSKNDYRSPLYSLFMKDEFFEYDPSTSEMLDEDGFGQGFQMPAGLTSIKINYSRMYLNVDPADEATYELWTLDSEGYLDQAINYDYISQSPSDWTNEEINITDGSELAALAGKPAVLLFWLGSDRLPPFERIYLDDAQLTACFATGAIKVYLPIVIKQLATTVPTCTPTEPDSRDSRGYMDVGATCNGAFSPTDDKDYYTLLLKGASDVRLQLANLPSGSNYDALIYESPYTGQGPACQIGTPGSGNKSVDCTLNVSKSYFVLVSAGSRPSSPTTYQLSVVKR